jgi:hypothetical protein
VSLPLAVRKTSMVERIDRHGRSRRVDREPWELELGDLFRRAVALDTLILHFVDPELRRRRP